MKFLIAEDERYVYDFIVSNILNDIDVVSQIEYAPDGNIAIDILTTGYIPDILITDIRMPGADGIMVAEKFRELNPNGIILVISAYSEKEYLMSAIKLHVFAYLEKPIVSENTKKIIIDAIINLRKNDTNFLKDNNLFDTLIHTPPAKLNHALTKHPTTSYSLLSNCVYRVGILKFFSKQIIQDADYIHFTLENIIKRFGVKCLTMKKNNSYLFLIFEDRNSDKSVYVMDSIDKVLLSMQKEISVSEIHIAVGSLANHLEDISTSYQNAVIETERAFITFNASNPIKYVVHSSPVEDTKSFFKSDFTFFENFEHELLRNDMNNCIKLLFSLEKNIRQHPYTPSSTIKEVYMHIKLKMHEFILRNNIVSPFEQYNNEWLYSADSLSELTEKSIKMLNTLFDSLANTTNNKNTTKIVSFIRENYSNPNLSLQMIAFEFNLSIPYLSAIFKKDTNITINQYIIDVRIHNAKHLLTENLLTITEIAQKTGFVDLSYFSKVFKKKCGISPSEYQKIST